MDSLEDYFLQKRWDEKDKAERDKEDKAVSMRPSNVSEEFARHQYRVLKKEDALLHTLHDERSRARETSTYRHSPDPLVIFVQLEAVRKDELWDASMGRSRWARALEAKEKYEVLQNIYVLAQIRHNIIFQEQLDEKFWKASVMGRPYGLILDFEEVTDSAVLKYRLRRFEDYSPTALRHLYYSLNHPDTYEGEYAPKS